MDRIVLMECPIAECSHDEALDWMERAVRRKSPTYLVTINAQYFWRIERDIELRRYVMSAGLVVPEYFVVWAGRRLGYSTLNHIGGINLFSDFLEQSSRVGFRVYLLGAKEEVVNSLAQQIAEEFGPNLIVGWHDGFLSPDEEMTVAMEIRSLKPDVVFVAMGVPRQDRWIQQYGHSLGIPLCMGVGGTFDVLAGFKPDTPTWARGRGLEWLYRIYIDPRSYFFRYMQHHTWFMVQVLRGVTKRMLSKTD